VSVVLDLGERYDEPAFTSSVHGYDTEESGEEDEQLLPVQSHITTTSAI